MDTDNEEILQESPRAKAKWLAWAKGAFPIGARVRVLLSDLDEYVGATGVVTNHDVGFKGDYPYIGVAFDEATTCELRRKEIEKADGNAVRDSFADDELELIQTCPACTSEDYRHITRGKTGEEVMECQRCDHEEPFDVMEEWTTYGKTWRDFSFVEKLAEPGIEISVRHVNPHDGSLAQEETSLLIGDINDMGGVCDDCKGIRAPDVVVKYRRAVER